MSQLFDPKSFAKAKRFDVIRDSVHTAIDERKELLRDITLGHLRPFDKSMEASPAILETTLSQLRGEIAILETVASACNSLGLANDSEVTEAIVRGFNR